VIENGNAHLNGTGPANGAVTLVPPPAAQPTPTVTLAPPVPEPTPETLIFRAGLLTPDQLGELVQERVSSGRTVEQIVVDRGWADAATVARALGLEPPAAEVAVPVVEVAVPVVEVAAPVVESHAPVAQIPTQPVEVHVQAAQTAAPSAAVAEPAPLHVVTIPVAESSTELVETEATAIEFRVVLRFAGNEVTEMARFETATEAKDAAHAIAAELAGARDEWPFLGGRYVRPEAVLSVDVDAIVR
jgi:hypothetical protein